MGLVVLTGLDLIYNAVHKTIWDSFANNRRPDRVPLQFQPLNADHEYSKSRPKRTSYEWYIPKGILKTSWMHKHLEQIPAVVVVFFDLDWDEFMWKERQMECSTRVEIVRNSLSGRGTKVCVVLVQKNAPLPPGEDVMAAERAASLCSACELSAKSLFVLPITDHLLGYTIRLENAYYEMAQSYYHTEARRVKTHKDYLNKTTHQLLFVRHQFKIAFFNELKQDTHTALKHYKQAYGHILELRMLDTNLLEVKSVAGFINYKICRLSFQHNTPLDAISQFRKHIDFFKARVGIVDLAFEHSAWMAKQFQVFGDLFDEAIKLGLTAIQTQHPGIYFQQAAYQSINRKQLCQTHCLTAATGATDALEHLNNLDYYGQRPWRQGHQSIEPPDPVKEKEGIQALQALELKVDHCWIIIPLLGSAVTQFKKYRSPRMKRYLMVQMGEEYDFANDFGKALTLLSRVTWEYRQERWWNLLTSILKTSLRCAYLTGNVQEYVTICVELIGRYALLSAEEKMRIQMNLNRILANKEPEPEPGCKQQYIEAAQAAWKQFVLGTEPVIFNIETSIIVPFAECKAKFSKVSYSADSPVVIKVYFRSCAPFPLRFSKLSVLLTNQAYNKYCVIVDDDDGSSEKSLFVKPDDIIVKSFSFMAQFEDVGGLLEISSITLELGCAASRCAVLHWNGAGGDAVALPPSQQRNCFIMHVSESQDESSLPWEQIEANAIARVLSREANLEVVLEHDATALLNEFLRFQVSLTNREEAAIDNVQISLCFAENLETEIQKLTAFYLDPTESLGKKSLNMEQLGHIEKEQKLQRKFYTKAATTGELVLKLSAMYDIKVEGCGGVSVLCRCQEEKLVKVLVVDPLDVSIQLESLKFEHLESVYSDEPFLLLASVKCSSPSPIHIQSSWIELSPHVKFVDKNIESQLSGLTMNSGDLAAECFCLCAPTLMAQTNVPIGNYFISLKRNDSDPDMQAIVKMVPLPSVNVEQIPVYVDVDMPANGCVQSVLPITYNIRNRTPYLQEMEASMESSEAFMFAGQRQVHFGILPNSSYQLKYNLVPLIPGNVNLPKLQINMTRYPDLLASIVQKMLPADIFVQPRSRSGATSCTGA